MASSISATLIAGDTYRFSFSILDADGTPHVMQEGETLTVSVRKKARPGCDPIVVSVFDYASNAITYDSVAKQYNCDVTVGGSTVANVTDQFYYVVRFVGSAGAVKTLSYGPLTFLEV